MDMADYKDMDNFSNRAPNTALGLSLTTSSSCEERPLSSTLKRPASYIAFPPANGSFMNFLAPPLPSHFNRSEDVCARPSPSLPLELLPLKPTSHPNLSLSPPTSKKPSLIASLSSALMWHHPIAPCATISTNFFTGIDVNQRPLCADDDEIAMDLLSPGRVPTANVHRTLENSLILMKRECERSSETEQERTCEVSSRGGSDEEGEGGGIARKKLRLSKEQSTLLEESFKAHSTLNPKQKAELAKQLFLRPRQVEVWFQNRRARTKLKQTEVDCEVLKRRCESLTEENRRLQREVAELRAIKMAPPCVISPDLFMPLPAATLSICPSCQRVASHTPAPPHAASSPSPSSKSSPPPPSPHLHHRHEYHRHLPQLLFPHPHQPPQQVLPSAAS